MGDLGQFLLLIPKQGTAPSSEIPVTIWVQIPMPERPQDLDLQVFEYNELSRRCVSINSQYVGQNIIYFTSQVQLLYRAKYKQTGPCLCHIQ